MGVFASLSSQPSCPEGKEGAEVRVDWTKAAKVKPETNGRSVASHPFNRQSNDSMLPDRQEIQRLPQLSSKLILITFLREISPREEDMSELSIWFNTPQPNCW